MSVIEKNRIQCPIRLPKSDYDKVRAKAIQDRIKFQKLVEVLLLAYVKNNKEIDRLVQKYVQEKKAKKGKYLDEIEKNAIYGLIEEESPLKHLEEAIKEIKEEDEQNLYDRDRF